MKKYVLTLITCAMALPLFSFNFDNVNFEIDADIKADLNSIILQEVKITAKESKKFQMKKNQQKPSNKIVTAVTKEMEFALKQINRNVKMRKNIFTRNFVEQQKTQKQKYENMLAENVPYQIFNYIASKFDIDKIKNLHVSCWYNDDTLVEVKFHIADKLITIYYDYNYKNKKGIISPLSHRIS